MCGGVSWFVEAGDLSEQSQGQEAGLWTPEILEMKKKSSGRADNTVSNYCTDWLNPQKKKQTLKNSLLVNKSAEKVVKL